jgi:hypothetical protein
MLIHRNHHVSLILIIIILVIIGGRHGGQATRSERIKKDLLDDNVVEMEED